jgi:putative endonuclease
LPAQITQSDDLFNRQIEPPTYPQAFAELASSIIKITSSKVDSVKEQVMDRQEVGKLGEKAAQKFLKKRGYRIRETGFRCHHGEIDIVAQKKDCLIFVEVRTKSNLEFGSPEESLTEAKKKKLIACALTYITSHQKLPSEWRIDVVAVELDDKRQNQAH